MTYTSTMNVPCTGKFTASVYEDGFWEVNLDAVDGERYYRGRGTLLPEPQFLSGNGEIGIIEDWMWDAVQSTINDLFIKMEKGAINVDVKGHD